MNKIVRFIFWFLIMGLFVTSLMTIEFKSLIRILLYVLIVGPFMGLFFTAAIQKPVKEHGLTVVRASKVFLYMPIVGIPFFVAICIFLPLKMFLIYSPFFILVLLGQAYILLIYFNHYIKYNLIRIEYRSVWGRQAHILWKDVREVRFSMWNKLILTTKKTSLSIEPYLLGFVSFVNTMKKTVPKKIYQNALGKLKRNVHFEVK